MDKPQKYHTKWKNSNVDDYIFYVFIFMEFPEKSNLEIETKGLPKTGDESRVNCKLAWENLEDNESVLKLECNDGCTTL